MPLFEIKHRWNGSVLFSLECGSMKLCVEAAVRAGADLRYTNLSSADLRYANLSYADLRYANLSYTNLSYADLSYADLSYTNLSSADLRYANLSYADLTKEQLVWFRDDIWAVLSSSPAEVLELREALMSGKVDGSTYEGDCCCLVGTLANARHCEYDQIPGLAPNSSRPAEQWFYGIKKGDTPETHRASKLALEWVDQWMGNMRAAFGADLFTEGRA